MARRGGCVIVGDMNRSFLLLSLLFTAACSSSSSNGGGGSDAASDVTNPSDSSTEDATNDVTTSDVSTSDVETTDSGTTPPTDAGSDVTSSNDSGSADSGGGSSDASGDGGDGAAAQVTLTVHDYLNWCTVTVNGGTASTSDPQTYSFAPGTSVSAHGDTANASAFYWGYWGNVAADGGLSDGGEDLGKTVTFTITHDMTINACCPDNGQPLSQCTF